MEVRLLHSTPLELADLAIGKCWNKPAKDVGHMIERMYRVGNKNKHASTLEHVNYTFDIDGISRACLQELARHRHQSLSVKSTRYTLKELKEADLRINVVDGVLESHTGHVWDFIIPVDDVEVNRSNVEALGRLQTILQSGTSNDIAKYAIPEAYKTSLVSTMNMRGLQNFLALRTSKAALWEIRELAQAMYEVVPDAHKFMIEEFVNGND